MKTESFYKTADPGDLGDAFTSFDAGGAEFKKKDHIEYENQFIDEVSKLPSKMVSTKGHTVIHTDNLDMSWDSFTKQNYESKEALIEHAKKSPIILLKFDGESFVLDGQHRLQTAIEEGLEEIPAVEITLNDFEAGREEPQVCKDAIRNLYPDKMDSGILDFPRKTLLPELFDDNMQMREEGREFILSTVERELDALNIEPKYVLLYGGSASYQWYDDTDLDVSVYIDWGETDLEPSDVQSSFKKKEYMFGDHPMHIFVKSPEESVPNEVADAVYDVLEDQWVLKPVEFDADFDPMEEYADYIKEAEELAEEYDEKWGKIVRLTKYYKKNEETLPLALNPDLVQKRMDLQRQQIYDIAKWFTDEVKRLRSDRSDIHNELREKIDRGEKLEPLERIQKAEVIWKYLDQAGLTSKMDVFTGKNKKERI